MVSGLVPRMNLLLPQGPCSTHPACSLLVSTELPGQAAPPLRPTLQTPLPAASCPLLLPRSPPGPGTPVLLLPEVLLEVRGLSGPRHASPSVCTAVSRLQSLACLPPPHATQAGPRPGLCPHVAPGPGWRGGIRAPSNQPEGVWLLCLDRAVCLPSAQAAGEWTGLRPPLPREHGETGQPGSAWPVGSGGPRPCRPILLLTHCY